MFQELIEESRNQEVNCLRPNSLRTYSTYINSYEKKMTKIEGAPPAMPITEEKMRGFIMYITKKQDKPATFNTIKLYVASFANYFKEKNQQDLTKIPSFVKFIKSIRLESTDAPPNRKEPITKEMMRNLVEKIDLKDPNDVEFFTMTSLMYFGFMRFSEVKNLLVSDINFENMNININIKISKGDKFGKGTTCYISKSNESYNSYKWLKLHMEFIPFKNETSPLFRYTNFGYNVRLRKKLKEIGIKDFVKFSAHSLRRGGAHEAAKAGVEDNVIQRHGRWKSTIFMIYTIMERKAAGTIITTRI